MNGQVIVLTPEEMMMNHFERLLRLMGVNPKRVVPDKETEKREECEEK